MAINFPTSLDTFTNPSSANTLDSPSHSVQHSDINDAVEAIEAKIGVGSSTAGSATAGYALVNTSGGTTAYSLLGVTGLSSGTAVANTVLTANGSGAATFAPTAQGLTLIKTQSFSSVANSSVDDVFSATYRNYRVVIDYVSATTSGVFSLRMRASGADNSTSNYQRTIIFMGASTPLQTRTNNSSIWDINGNVANAYYSLAFDLFTPFASLHTHASGFNEYQATSTSVNEVNLFQLGFTGTTSFDGISLLSSGSNITGQISVYGYNN
jgi:hypothetical protein